MKNSDQQFRKTVDDESVSTSPNEQDVERIANWFASRGIGDAIDCMDEDMASEVWMALRIAVRYARMRGYIKRQRTLEDQLSNIEDVYNFGTGKARKVPVVFLSAVAIEKRKKGFKAQ